MQKENEGDAELEPQQRENEQQEPGPVRTWKEKSQFQEGDENSILGNTCTLRGEMRK